MSGVPSFISPIDGSEDGELLAGASAARDIVGGRRETALALEAEERSMLELVRAAAVQRERESETTKTQNTLVVPIAI